MTNWRDLDLLSADELAHLAAAKRMEERLAAERKEEYLAALLDKPALGAYRDWRTELTPEARKIAEQIRAEFPPEVARRMDVTIHSDYGTPAEYGLTIEP